MITLVSSIFSLLLGIGIILVGAGFLGTVLGMRAMLENFSEMVTGLVMSAYFLGFIVGAYVCPPLINRVGHIRAFSAMAAVASAAILTHALVIDPWAWAALRLITGLCSVGLYMVIESWLNAQSSQSAARPGIRPVHDRQPAGHGRGSVPVVVQQCRLPSFPSP